LTSTGTAASAEESYNISFFATDDITAVSGLGVAGPARTLAAALERSPSAYLPEAYAAMQALLTLNGEAPAAGVPRHSSTAGVARAASMNPFSAFYSVLLPAGLSHTLNQSATLTLSYSSSVDPATINVYYFDGAKYLIEKTNRRIDTVNRTITVSVSHFSTFVVLQNDAPVVLVDGDAYVGGDIEVFNFPNPFDLTTKTKTLNRGGATTSLSTDGTIIRYSIPASKAGAAEITIYNVIGENVRSIALGTPSAGTVHYVSWDGKNDAGEKVASGVYIGVLKVGGSKKFWKMAVLK
jgi:hypothetical protein